MERKGAMHLQYGEVRQAHFLERPNRFIAHVELEGETVVCHVKNTGRCRELLVPGATVYLERGTNPARRTAWDLIAVEKGHRLINMDAQAPNRIFAQWIRQQEPGIAVHPEYRYGDSRLDFCLEWPEGLHLAGASEKGKTPILPFSLKKHFTSVRNHPDGSMRLL